MWGSCSACLLRLSCCRAHALTGSSWLLPGWAGWETCRAADWVLVACLHDDSDIALCKHGCQEQGRADSLLWNALSQGCMLSTALAASAVLTTGPPRSAAHCLSLAAGGAWLQRLWCARSQHTCKPCWRSLTWRQRGQLDAQRLRMLPDRLEGQQILGAGPLAGVLRHQQHWS